MGCKHSTPTIVPDTSPSAPVPSTTVAISSPTTSSAGTNSPPLISPDHNHEHIAKPIVPKSDKPPKSSLTSTSPTNTPAKPAFVPPKHPTSKKDMRGIPMKASLPAIRIQKKIIVENKIYEITDHLIGKTEVGEIYKTVITYQASKDNKDKKDNKKDKDKDNNRSSSPTHNVPLPVTADENKTFIACKIMNKDIFPTPEAFQEFKKINYIAAEQQFGPKIYDIIDEEDDNIYIFMEFLNGGLKKWIQLHLLVPDDEDEDDENSIPMNFNMLLPDIKAIVAPIHQKMYDNRITLGEDTIDKYMYSSTDQWYRLDYTHCKFFNHPDDLDEEELMKYQQFIVVNPETQEMKKIYQLLKHL